MPAQIARLAWPSDICLCVLRYAGYFSLPRLFRATLDHDDMQISASSRSQINVRPVVDKHGAGHVRHDAQENDLHIHAVGGATLTFVQKHEGVHSRTRFHPLPTETSISSFSGFRRSFQQSVKEICSNETTQDIVEFVELCVHRLVWCEQSECRHNLVRLLVRLSSCLISLFKQNA
jgi:hypothetical protein